MKKEFTAKTLDEAKESAAAEFGVSVDEIEFDILEQPRKGLFGMKGNARVMASYEAPAAEEAPAAAQTEESAPAEEPAPASFEDENESAAVPELPADFDIEKSAKVQAAKKYLTDVLHALGLENFQINAIRRDGNIVLDITGDKLGVVIGRRGETLDSLQYLTILASNRTEESYCRISIDCNGYRDKRRETLESLAKRTSAKVIKQGRKIALEPMNPYERRIIHSCVAEIEGVSSHSTGVEPYRKVVIYADKPKFDNRRPRRSGDRNDHGERRGSGNTRNYRQSTGFSTSFEREYKRRTYEPDENANAGEFSKETVDAEKNATLYGKIEI
ncbi:MAG: protein jag [Ruminococcaceae bacterium]|nr:protein jag [Oscillospiraceae bacterium]